MRRNKSDLWKVTAVILTAAIAMSEGGYSLQAAEALSKKEEVVYAILDSDGTVDGVYVVNSVAGGDVLDYGEYTKVRNLTSEDEITLEGDKISFHTEEDKVYYQGDLENKEIPWEISVTYRMDGREYSAKEIAGMSGALEIILSVTQNEKCDASFYEGYALQTTLTLDGNKCSSLEAEGATIANVGSDKQISYIVLPGKGMERTIKADVIDFEMDAISINGTKLNLEIELDEENLQDKVGEIQEAVTSLNDGAKDLDSGVADLDDGAKELYDGTKTLDDGAQKLGEGTGTLNDGAAKLNESAGVLNGGVAKIDSGASELKSGAEALKNGTVTVNKGAKEIKEGMSGLNTGIATIEKALKELEKQSDTLTKGSGEVLAALKTIQNSLTAVSIDAESLKQLSEASTAVKGGIDSLTEGLGAMDGGISSYYEGLSQAGISDMDSYLAAHQNVIAALTAMNTDGQYTDVINLLTADAAYLQASNTLIGSIDQNLDSQTGALMLGALSLQSNYEAFDSSIQGMVTTLSSLTGSLTELKNGIDTLVTNYSALDTGISSYTGAVGQIVEGYKEVSEGAAKLKKATAELYTGTGSLVEGSKSLYTGTGTLKNGTAELLKGTGQLVDGTKELAEGAGEVNSGALELAGGSAELITGTKELTEGTEKLKDGTKELKEGTEEFYSETKDMDTEISDTIHETIDEMTGKEVEIKSFVSEKNTNIESVLFVMKTPAVEKAEAEDAAEEKEETLSFWQKVVQLFR